MNRQVRTIWPRLKEAKFDDQPKSPFETFLDSVTQKQIFDSNEYRYIHLTANQTPDNHLILPSNLSLTSDNQLTIQSLR
jgi:hypothetical protein